MTWVVSLATDDATLSVLLSISMASRPVRVWAPAVLGGLEDRTADLLVADELNVVVVQAVVAAVGANSRTSWAASLKIS